MQAPTDSDTLPAQAPALCAERNPLQAPSLNAERNPLYESPEPDMRSTTMHTCASQASPAARQAPFPNVQNAAQHSPPASDAAQLEAMRQEITSYQAMFASMSDAARELETEKALLTERLAEVEASLDVVICERDDARSAIRTGNALSTSALDAASGAVPDDQLQVALEAAQHRVQHLESEKAGTDAAAAVAAGVLRSTQNELKAAQSRIQLLEQAAEPRADRHELAETAAKLREAEGRVEELLADMDDAEERAGERYAALMTEFELRALKIADLEADLLSRPASTAADAPSEVARLQSELQAGGMAAAMVQEQLQRLEAAVAARECELTEVRAQLATAEAAGPAEDDKKAAECALLLQVQAAEAAVTAAQERARQQEEAHAEALKALRDEHAKASAQLEQEVATLQARVHAAEDEHQRALTNLREELERMASTQSSDQDIVQQVEASMAALLAEREAERSEWVSLQESAAVKHERAVLDLQAQVHALEQAAESSKRSEQDSSQTVQQLTQQLDDALQAVADMEDQSRTAAATASERAAELGSGKEAAEAEATQLRAQLERRDSALEAMAAELHQAQERADSAQAALESRFQAADAVQQFEAPVSERATSVGVNTDPDSLNTLASAVDELLAVEASSKLLSKEMSCAYHAQLAEMQAERDAQSGELVNARKQAAELETQAVENYSQLEAAQSAADSAASVIEKLEADLAAVQQEHGHAVQELADVQAHAADAAAAVLAERDAAQDAEQSVRAEVAALQAALADAEVSVAARTAAVAELQAAAEAQSATESAALIRQLKQEVNELDEQAETRGERVTVLEAELERVQGDLAERSATVEQLRGELACLEEDSAAALEVHRQQVAALAVAQATQEAQNNPAADPGSVQTADASKTQQATEAAVAEVADVRRKLKNAVKRGKAMQAERDGLAEQVKEAESRLAHQEQLCNDVDRLTAELCQRGTELEAVKVKLEELQSSESTLRAQARSADTLREELQQTLDVATDKAARVDELEQELLLARQVESEMQSKIASNAEKLAAAQATLHDMATRSLDAPVPGVADIADRTSADGSGVGHDAELAEVRTQLETVRKRLRAAVKKGKGLESDLTALRKEREDGALASEVESSDARVQQLLEQRQAAVEERNLV